MPKMHYMYDRVDARPVLDRGPEGERWVVLYRNDEHVLTRMRDTPASAGYFRCATIWVPDEFEPEYHSQNGIYVRPHWIDESLDIAIPDTLVPPAELLRVKPAATPIMVRPRPKGRQIRLRR